MNRDACGCHMCSPHHPPSHFQPSILSSAFLWTDPDVGGLYSLYCCDVPLFTSPILMPGKDTAFKIQESPKSIVYSLHLHSNILFEVLQADFTDTRVSGIQSVGVTVSSGLDMTTAIMQSSCDHQETLMKSGLLTSPHG